MTKHEYINLVAIHYITLHKLKHCTTQITKTHQIEKKKLKSNSAHEKTATLFSEISKVIEIERRWVTQKSLWRLTIISVLF